MVEAAVVERVDLPIRHLVRAAPRHGTRRDWNLPRFTGRQELRRVVHGALHVLTAPEWIASVSEAFWKSTMIRAGRVPKPMSRCPYPACANLSIGCAARCAFHFGNAI